MDRAKIKHKVIYRDKLNKETKERCLEKMKAINRVVDWSEQTTANNISWRVFLPCLWCERIHIWTRHTPLSPTTTTTLQVKLCVETDIYFESLKRVKNKKAMSAIELCSKMFKWKLGKLFLFL